MEGKTHYIGGSIGAMTGYILLKENNMLLDSVHPTLQFGMIYLAGTYGGMIPDADHHAGSNPMKDPVGVLFNRMLHIFNKPFKRMDSVMSSSHKKRSFVYKLLSILKCSHRSWQTHSELTLLFFLYFIVQLLSSNTSDPSVAISVLLLTGLSLGVLSHLVLDLLTAEGIKFATGIIINTFFPRIPMIESIRLVPKWHTFTTGSPYELTVRYSLNVIQYFLLGYSILTFFGYSIITV
ncbi:metal-dependent hydrolase [Bacillus cereus]|uniref:metal-dependent hydrolase n=1 Tax=Bacillus cereus TaxID=1396 RepID=UPI003D16873F